MTKKGQPREHEITIDEWETVSRYEITRRLGEGGDGVVYLAKLKGPDSFEQLFVIKVPMYTEQAITNLKEEARVLLRFAHPNIVAVRDYGYATENVEETEGPTAKAKQTLRKVPVLVLQHGGITLSQLLRSAGRLEPGLAIAIALQVCAALAHAHLLNIVHRDIKPDNVLINRAGLVTVIDWGIAKGEHRADKTAENKIKGTPTYLTPEMIRCEALDARTDVWQVGSLLYQMLTGATPWIQKPVHGSEKDMEAWLFAVTGQILHERHPAIPEELVPSDVMAVIDRCLEKNRGKRYPNMTELIRALDQVRIVPPHIANVEVGQHVCAAEDSLTRNPTPSDAAATVPIQAENRVPARAGTPIKLAESSIQFSDSMTLSSDIIAPPAAARGAAGAVVVPAPSARESAPVAPLDSNPLAGSDEKTEEFSVSQPRGVRRGIAALAMAAAMGIGAVLALRTGQTDGPSTAAPSVPMVRASEPLASPSSPPRLEVPERPALSSLPHEGKVLEGAAPASARALDENKATSNSEPAAVEAPLLASSSTNSGDAQADRPEGHKPSKPASLNVIVVPSEALISLDGRKPIPSPASFADLRPGRHVLRAGLANGSVAKEQRVKLSSGPNEIRIVLVDPFANPFAASPAPTAQAK